MIDRPKRSPTDDSRIVRVGAVSYLNSKPLIESFENLAPHARLTLDLPSRLADDLSSGDLDVALIPSVEAFLDPEYEIVSDACVAARGPVLSVKMYSRVTPGEIRSLALDEGSRTSAALVRILLSERYGTLPEVHPLPIGKSPWETDTDAVLVIGDRAMHTPNRDYHTTWDLSEQWKQWTGLPFVFAMWVTRHGTELFEIERALVEARNHGLEALHEIARREALHLGIDGQTARDYLRHNLHFRIGSAERNGFALVPPTGEAARFRS